MLDSGILYTDSCAQYARYTTNDVTITTTTRTIIPVRTSPAIFRGVSYIAHRGTDNELANAEHGTNNIIYDTHIHVVLGMYAHGKRRR